MSQSGGKNAFNRLNGPSVAVDVLLFAVGRQEPENYRKLPEHVLQVFLIKQGEAPFLGQWALPGGSVGPDEYLDEAAYRQLAGKTQVSNVYMEQLYTWGDLHRDPRTRVISCSYMALTDKPSEKIQSGDDARWFTVRRKVIEQRKEITEKGYILRAKILIQLFAEDVTLRTLVNTVKTVEGKISRVRRETVEPGRIAFDHALILECGIERLRSKLAYTDIAFNLMPEFFTLTQLQQVYEAVLDKKLIKANFRRKMAGFLRETSFMTKDEGHRPAKLYCFKPGWMNCDDEK